MIQKAGTTLRGVAAVSALALLMGCAETQLGAQVAKQVVRDNGSADTAAAPNLAPDSFQATGLTIWDGATTLEGVWVAHPLAQRAQRVSVTNVENGLEVEGAMFRRDPTLSGPSILVSSDAARQLGLQPGRPTELSIIALREGVYPSPSGGGAQGGQVETSELPSPSQETDVAAAEDGAAEDSGAGGFARVDDNTQAPTADPGAQQPAKTAVTSADLTASSGANEATAEPAPLEPLTPEAPEPEPEPIETAEAPAPEPQEAPAAAPQPAAPSPALTDGGADVTAFPGELPKGLFVQAGAFGVEENARNLVARLRTAGLPTNYVQRNVNGTLFNIVMIGPLADVATADVTIATAATNGAPGGRKVVR